MSVRWGLFGAGVVIAGLFTLGRITGWWLGRSEELTSRQRSVHDNLSYLVPLSVIVGVPLLFRAFPVGYSLFPSGPVVAGALANSAIAITVSVAALAGALRGLKPFRATLPRLEAELWQRNRRVLLYSVVFVLFAAVTIEFGFLYAARPAGLLLWVVLVVFVGLFLSGFLALPSACPYVRFGIRRPTEAERERIEQVYERLEIPLPDGIEITVQDDHQRMVVLENDDQRVLALSDSTLSSFDSDTLSVGIAHAEGRAIHGVSLFEKAWISTLLSAIVLYIWTFSMLVADTDLLTEFVPGATLLVLTMVFVIAVIGGWGRERVRSVDEYTVEHADPSTVVAVYGGDSRLGFIQRRKTIGRDFVDNLLGKVAPEPTIEERIEKVEPADGRGASSSS